MHFLHQSTVGSGSGQAGDCCSLQVVWFVLVVALPLSLSLGGNALAKQPGRSLPQAASCPYGFYRSGDRCLSTPGSTRKAVERVGTSCPLGWFSSGSYCVRYR